MGFESEEQQRKLRIKVNELAEMSGDINLQILETLKEILTELKRINISGNGVYINKIIDSEKPKEKSNIKIQDKMFIPKIDIGTSSIRTRDNSKTVDGNFEESLKAFEQLEDK